MNSPRHKTTPDRLERIATMTGRRIEIDTAAQTAHLRGSRMWAELERPSQVPA